jgi:hypothetical protein
MIESEVDSKVGETACDHCGIFPFSFTPYLISFNRALFSDMKRDDDSHGDPKPHMPPQFPFYCDRKTKHHNERHSTPAGYRDGRRLIRDALD